MHEVLFIEGKPGHALYLIRSGQVKIVRDSLDGQETILWVAAPGEYLGEITLVDEQPRSATVVALGHVEALLLYRETFEALLERRPAVARAAMSGLAQRVRRVSEQLEEALWLDVPGRIAGRLLTLAAQFELETEEGIRIPLCLTREEFAQCVGTVRTTVSTELRRLEARGILRIDREGITLHRVERLRKRSGG